MRDFYIPEQLFRRVELEETGESDPIFDKLLDDQSPQRSFEIISKRVSFVIGLLTKNAYNAEAF